MEEYGIVSRDSECDGCNKHFLFISYDKVFTLRCYKFNPLAINSKFTAETGKAGFTLASAATAVVEFMAKWSNLCPSTVSNVFLK